MTRLEELRDLLAYHRWANARVLDAAAGLSPEDFDRDLGGSFPSIRATLAHVVGADWIWLSRWQGSSPNAPPPWPLATHAEIAARWSEVGEAQRWHLESLGEAELDRPLEYRALNGTAYRNPMGQLIRHLVNHGTYHRGQVVTMLRQVGVSPPPTDLIVYYRER